MAFLGVGHPSMLTGSLSLLATESNTVLIAVDEVSLLEAVEKKDSGSGDCGLIVSGFRKRHFRD
jgi:hypothetical protein